MFYTRIRRKEIIMSKDDRDEPELIKLWPDAARIAQLGRNAIYQAAANNEIPTIRIGNAIRVPLRVWRRKWEAEHGGDAA
jgi:hypothetical protein